MPRISVFADESGNFDFSRKDGASRHFILTTITCQTYAVGDALLNLRRELAWDGLGLDSEFHATTDSQAVRDRVFGVLQAHDFRIDTTILEKAKARPDTRSPDERFYQYAWYLHMERIIPIPKNQSAFSKERAHTEPQSHGEGKDRNHLAGFSVALWLCVTSAVLLFAPLFGEEDITPQIVRAEDEFFVVGASPGTRRRRAAMHSTVKDVIHPISPTLAFRIASWDAHSDPCLQAADYCCWAVRRKWELQDTRSYDLIRDKIESEYDAWELGTTKYY